MRPVTDFLRGVGMYWRGVRTWASDPALMALGLMPGLITAWLFVGAFIAMALWLDSLSNWIASLTVGEGGAHQLVQVAAALGVVGATLLIVVYGFVATTTVIGQPFFERVSHAVDDALGPVADGPDWPWWRNAARGVGEGLRLSLITVPASIAVVLLVLSPWLERRWRGRSAPSSAGGSLPLSSPRSPSRGGACFFETGDASWAHAGPAPSDLARWRS